MIGPRILLGITLILSAVAGSSHAAIPRESINVVFQDAEPMSEMVPFKVVFGDAGPVSIFIRGYEPGTLRYQLGFGDEFWQSGRRLRICSPAYVAKSINMASRGQPLVRILLDVPGRVALSTVAEAVDRLTNLAAANAKEGCNVEIIVFPDTPTLFVETFASDSTQPTPARQTSSSSAAATKNGGSAVFRDKLAVVRGSDIGALGYHLSTAGDVCSSAGIPPEVEIAETIDSSSRLYRSLYVTLEVDLPDSTKFENITAAIDRVKHLASLNAVDGCKVEIVVFPSAVRANSAEPSAAH